MTPRRDWRLWVLLGLFLLLLGLELATPGLDSDQAVTGLMGRHVLRGELPLFFWRQNHAGVPEAYGAAVLFQLFGSSRLVLGLVPALAALALVLVLYRTGAVLFGHGAGLLAMLFATAVSPYVAAHYVLARGYYIEQILAGQVVLLAAGLWLRHGTAPGGGGEPARARLFLAMGLAGGFGLYCGLQIVDALVPACLVLLLVDPRLPLRRGAWLGLGAFALASLPFWLFNLTHGWATLETGAHLRRDDFGPGEALRHLVLELIPVVLGVKTEVRGPTTLAWPGALAVPLLVAAALGLLALRVARGARRLRRDPTLAGEALLLAAVLVTLGVVWGNQLISVARYLVPLAPVLALVLARACQLVWRRSHAGAVALAGLYLVGTGIPLARELAVLWPARRAEYRTARAADRALLDFLVRHDLRHAYGLDYWLAPRLTFDAAETLVVALPFNDRHPPYTRAVDAAPRPAYVLSAADPRLGAFESWLRLSGAGAASVPVASYLVVSGFTPPPPALPLPRTAMRAEVSPGKGAAASLLDARLETGWASAGGPRGSASVLLDLGAVRRVSGLALITDRPDSLPQVLEVSLADPGAAAAPVARLETLRTSVEWRNGALRASPSRTLTVRFAPVEARRLRLTDAGPGGVFALREVFVLGPGSTPARSPRLDEARRLEAAGQPGPAFLAYRRAMADAPDDPAGYLGLTRLTEILRIAGSPHPARAARYEALGLLDEARAIYAALAAGLPPGTTHVGLTQERARLAARAGDLGEAGRLRAQVEPEAAPAGPPRAIFGRRAALTAFELAPARVRPGEPVTVRARWQLLGASRAPLVDTLVVRGERARFADAAPLPRPIAGLDEAVQHVIARRQLVVPPGTPPGRYRVLVGVRDASSGQALWRWWVGLVPTTRQPVEVGTLEVLPPAP